jgi:phage terminase large subunit
MLCFYDEDVLNGPLKIASWQKEVLGYFGGNHKYGDRALEAMLLAANGSGKSQFIIAPLVVWFMIRYPESQTTITNASGHQLDSGNLRHINRLAEKINSFHRADFPNGIFECQYRKLKSLVTGSFCDMFATDEAGKVEGKHPLRYDGKFLIIIDEAKSVAEEIFDALLRSHDYTHKLLVTSAGKTSGTFYRDWHNNKLENIFRRRVAYNECPWISKQKVDDIIARKGISDPLVRSMFFSEFTSSEDNVVISRDSLIKCAGATSNWYSFGPVRAGLDLAAGGDETAITVWNGNKEIGKEQFDNKDTSKTVKEVISYIESFKGVLKPENVYADDGGVGRGILDNFREKGYNFRRILNNHRPIDITRYANRGTELWWNFKRFVEECQVLFMLDYKGNIDEKVLDQLSNRYYRIQDGSSKIILESKQKAKAEGHPSPDRADAIILAWSPFIYPIAEISGLNKKGETDKGISSAEIADKLRSTERDKVIAMLNGSNHASVTLPARLTEKQMLVANTYRHKEIFKTISNRSNRKYFR